VGVQVLDWDNAAYQQLNPGDKLVNMYFQVHSLSSCTAFPCAAFTTHDSPRQTIAIRTGGFNSVDLTKLSAAILWLYTGTYAHAHAYA
jgi:Trk-type K+ transport system membrane component